MSAEAPREKTFLLAVPEQKLLDVVALAGAALMGVALFRRALANLRVLAAREPYAAP